MRVAAFTDLIILAIVFWAVWSLRFAGVENVGVWSMLAGVGVGAVLLWRRKETWRSIGLLPRGGVGWTLARAGEFGLLILVTGAVAIGAVTALGYPPSQSSVLENQPQEFTAFLLDILIGVWLGAAIGEEIFFRGFLLTKFQQLFGGGRFALFLAMAAQAAWFGAGHASQGIGGIAVTGAIGFAIAVYYVTRARRSLVPLIIGHGLVNTVTLSINYWS